MGVKPRSGVCLHKNGSWWLLDKYQNSGTLESAYGPYDPADCCFYCGSNLSGEAVLYWHGTAPQEFDKSGKHCTGVAALHLHPGCFLELTTRLFRDLHAIQSVMDYRAIMNASPRPEYPPRDERSNERWAMWNKLRNSMRDLRLVRQ